MFRSPRTVHSIWIALFLLLTGCAEREQIRSDTVSRSPEEERARRAALAAGLGERRPRVESGADAKRMIAAMLPHRDRMWFFKLLGPQDGVDEAEDQFRAFLQSLQFEGGQAGLPTWDKPQGWSEQAGPPPAVKTLSFEAAGEPLKITVTPLSRPQGDAAQYTLMNVNRWRGQIGLSPIEFDQLPQIAKTVKLPAGMAMMVDMVGPEGSGSPTSTKARPDSPPAADLPFTFEAPPEWSPGRLTSLRRVAFVVRGDSGSAEVTVIPLAAQTWEQGALGNYNRWRGQVGLDEASLIQFEQAREQFTAGETEWDYLAIEGAEESGAQQAMRVAVAVEGGQAWFLKMVGDATVVREQEEAFRKFVRSVRFK